MNLQAAIERNRKREAEKKERWGKKAKEIWDNFHNPKEYRTHLDEIFNYKEEK